MLPSGVIKTIPTPNVGRPFSSVFEAPSKSKNLPGLWVLMRLQCSRLLRQAILLAILSSPYYEKGEDVLPSASACPFLLFDSSFCGTNIMSYCESSIDHLASRAFSEPALVTRIFKRLTPDTRYMVLPIR